MREGRCACGAYAVADERQIPRCLTCLRADHRLGETPSDVFRHTAPAVRRSRYALPMGTTARSSPLDASAGIAWRRAMDGRRPEALSAPETPCRAAYPGEVPLGAQRLAEGAARAGWRGSVTYARGRPIHASRGTNLKTVVNSIAVRLVHASGWRAVGVWHGDATKGAWAWLPGGAGRYAWPRNVGVSVLREWIESGNGRTLDEIDWLLSERRKRGEADGT